MPTQDLLERLVDEVHGIVWEREAGASTFRFVSAGAAEILGHAPERWTSEPHFLACEVIDAEDLDAVAVAHRLAAESGGPAVVDYRAVAADGRRLWLRDRVKRASGGPAERPALVGLTVDITDIKHRERHLAFEKEWQEALFNHLSELAWVKDAEGRFIAVNEALARLTGTTRQEMIGKTDFDFFPPEIAAAYEADDRRVVAGETMVRVEEPFVQPDGTTAWIETTKTPFRDADGSYVGTIGVARDITYRKQAEAKLAAAESHYRRLVETSPYGIYALDAEGRFFDVNASVAEILDRRPEELLGVSFLEFISPEDRPSALASFRRKLEAGGGVDEQESWVVRPSGERRRVLVRSIAVHEAGVGARSHGVIRDVTEERIMEAQLRRAERLASMGTLVGGVAHELNNPLGAIKGFAQLMLMDAHTPEDREALQTMLREADRAAKIVSHLRVLARQTQEEPRDRTAVDLNDVARHVLKLRRYTLSTSNVELVEDLDPGLPPIRANREQMEQVAVNLVVNAEDAMSGQDRAAVLTLRTRTAGERVCLEVADTGSGIPPQHLERIFDPFRTSKPPGRGTGLGLSLVHGIVAETGGSLEVESEVGVGTTFRVWLPPAPAPAAEEGAPDEALPAPARGRVLLVDDEEPIRRTIARFLTRRGFQVHEAREGGEALQMLRDVPAGGEFDVVLSDLRMPGLGGHRLLDALRADGRGYDRRLIVITGDSASSETAGILARVGVPVLYKPFDLDEIERTIVERIAEPR